MSNDFLSWTKKFNSLKKKYPPETVIKKFTEYCNIKEKELKERLKNET